MTYERLFSLTNYNNEKVAFTAELSEGENPHIVLAGLFQKVTEVHKFFEYLRTVLGYIETSRGRLAEYQHRITTTEQEIEKQKISIAELSEKLKTGDLNDDRMRHACTGTSLKELTAQLEGWKKSLSAEAKHKTELENFLSELEKRTQAGNLTLKGLELPEMRTDMQDDE